MKKILPFIAVVLFLFTACNKEGDIFGGRYYGTFYNTENQMSVDGTLSFASGKLYHLDTIIKIDTIIGLDSIPTIDSISISVGGNPTILIYDTFYVRDTFINPTYKSKYAFMLNHVLELKDSIKKKIDGKDTIIYGLDAIKQTKKCWSDTLTLNNPYLNWLLETMPAINKLGVCDPATDKIKSMHITAKFLGNNVESTMKFTTTNKPDTVVVKFNGALFE